MKIHLYLLTPSLVQLLTMHNRPARLGGRLFDTIYGAYKPEKVEKQNDNNIESELVRVIGTPSQSEAQGLHDIATELTRLRALAAQGQLQGDVAGHLQAFIAQDQHRRDAIEFLEKRFLPNAANRLRGKPKVVLPNAAQLANPGFTDPFASLLPQPAPPAAIPIPAGVIPAAPANAGTYAPMPSNPNQQNYAAMPQAPEQIYGAASSTAQPVYGSGPPEKTPEYGPGPDELKQFYGALPQGYVSDDNDAPPSALVSDDNDAPVSNNNSASTSTRPKKPRTDDNSESDDI